MSRNNNYTTDDLSNFAYLNENYRLIATALSRQTKLKDSKQTNFIGKIEGQTYRATILFIIEKIRRNCFPVFAKFCQYHIKMEMQEIVNLLNNSKNKCSKFSMKKMVRH